MWRKMYPFWHHTHWENRDTIHHSINDSRNLQKPARSYSLTYVMFFLWFKLLTFTLQSHWYNLVLKLMRMKIQVKQKPKRWIDDRSWKETHWNNSLCFVFCVDPSWTKTSLSPHHFKVDDPPVTAVFYSKHIPLLPLRLHSGCEYCITIKSWI